MKKLEITIGPKGETTVQTRGYYGKGCKEASRFIEEALGEVTADRKTPEYHQAEPTTNRNRQAN